MTFESYAQVIFAVISGVMLIFGFVLAVIGSDPKNSRPTQQEEPPHETR